MGISFRKSLNALMEKSNYKQGVATLKKYGKSHFKTIGSKGGQATKAKYGQKHFKLLAENRWKRRKTM